MKTKRYKKYFATPPEHRRLPDTTTKGQPCVGQIDLPSNICPGTLTTCEESSGQDIWSGGGA
ncbi:MAG: hypothetical protein IIC02_01725 [Planctomycetes bacterium]|nr:hypothetical protein [Planctomycetota bacterium]